jgi:hypothetical protein
MSDERRDEQVPDVSSAMPGEGDQSSVGGAAPDGSAVGRLSDAAEPGADSASGGSGGDSVADDDREVLGGAGPDAANPASKDPSDWVTGDEPMTGPQASYLDTLAREAGEELPGDLTKARASEEIDRLQEKTGRGQ